MSKRRISKQAMRRTRWVLPVVGAGLALTLMAAPAVACGGLVGENGTIQLTRTTTLAAYHDGVERYVTSFQFTGQGKEVGSIVPLPDVPTKVERAGDWTLQRLEREVAPPLREAAFDGLAKATSAAPAQVILETKIDALDITVLRGGGTAVGKWATSHGFLLTPDAPEMLDFYANRSPIFMAARFDASRAQTLGQNAGDGTPILLTIPTKEPWVPLRILGLGLGRNEIVNADVFLLTDHQPKLLAGGPGLSLDRNEAASEFLLNDLRADKHMEWVPDSMWFTFLRLNVPAGQLGYDLAISDHANAVPKLVDAGVTAAHARPIVPPDHFVWWPIALAGGVGLAAFALAGLGRRRGHTTMGTPA
jgi:hypothetical protein